MVGLLQRRGFTVYAGARGRAEFGHGVRMVALDVADPESVAAAAKQVAGQVDGLWAVINNAGVIVQGPVELVPVDEWRRQLEVNTLEAVIAETLNVRTSEREGRLIDSDQIGSMEKKKQEGYF